MDKINKILPSEIESKRLQDSNVRKFYTYTDDRQNDRVIVGLVPHPKTAENSLVRRREKRK